MVVLERYGSTAIKVRYIRVSLHPSSVAFKVVRMQNQLQLQDRLVPEAVGGLASSSSRPGARSVSVPEAEALPEGLSHDV